MLPPEPLVRPPVHPLGLLRERLHHVRATTEPLSDLLCPVQSPVHLVVPLALIGEVVAVPAQEIAPRPVQDDHPPAAAGSGADKPGPLSSEVAGRPLQRYRLLHVFPLGAKPPP